MSAFTDQRGDGSFAKAIVVSGAGVEEANGVYKATSREYCDAPVYEHSEHGADLKITREPHTNPKTGATKHGWLLGQKKTPLYGVQSELLMVPAAGWKKFSGAAPVPTIQVHTQLTEVFFAQADDAKTAGDAAVEKEDWPAALHFFASGIDALKRSGERFGDPFKNRAALLLSRRAAAFLKTKEYHSAMRDAIAALELVRGLTSAEVTAIEASKELGCKDDATAQKILEPVGAGRILDSGAPLVLRCVERWIDEVMENIKTGNPGDAAVDLPEPKHLAADRYLDGLSPEAREDLIKRYLPDLYRPDGGTGIIGSPEECHRLMLRWEESFNSPEFQKKKKDLWDKKGISYPVRMREQKSLVCQHISPLLEPMGFAPGQPGMTRAVKQMQVYWSADRVCANKAMDLEELADVSLADLE